MIVAIILMIATIAYVAMLVSNRLPGNRAIGPSSPAPDKPEVPQALTFNFTDLLVEARYNRERAKHVIQICSTQKHYASGHNRTLREVDRCIKSIRSQFLSALHAVREEAEKNQTTVADYPQYFQALVDSYRRKFDELSDYRKNTDSRTPHAHQLNVIEVLAEGACESVQTLETYFEKHFGNYDLK